LSKDDIIPEILDEGISAFGYSQMRQNINHKTGGSDGNRIGLELSGNSNNSGDSPLFVRYAAGRQNSVCVNQESKARLMRDLRMESAFGQNQPRQLFNKSMYSLGSRESNGNSLPGHA
jgi:hypothetical protein